MRYCKQRNNKDKVSFQALDEKSLSFHQAQAMTLSQSDPFKHYTQNIVVSPLLWLANTWTISVHMARAETTISSIFSNISKIFNL